MFVPLLFILCNAGYLGEILFDITVFIMFTVPPPSSVHFIAAPSIPLLLSILHPIISSEPVPSKPYSLFFMIQFVTFPPPPETPGLPF